MLSADVDTTPRATPEPSLASPTIGLTIEPAAAESLVIVDVSEPVSTSFAPDPARTASIGSNYSVEPPPKLDRTSSSITTLGHVPAGEPDHQIESGSEAEQDSYAEVAYVDKGIRESTGSQRTSEFPTFQEEDVFEEGSIDGPRSRSDSSGSRHSEDSGAVDWSELEKTEEEEARDGHTDESTAFLLARLEQENNALATDPRFGLKARSRKQSRPPSMQVLKKLVNDPNSRALRYSILPNPPPMTELEFWAALVKDYPQTAQRLPTLTANKVKSGIPPPLRGVVWMSMVGARDTDLADQFEKLCQETSPYENLIGKDIGRSFPGVDMFRDPNGEGQAMLGRVLRCFSLYDEEIGYCQGLGFLVGPLLMQMGDKDAFCILVKLMENYDLRSCFLPNLAGLHVRIYQFQRLLDEHMPSLAAHLKLMGVEAAYLSQWFLSFFAVTCPLPMLFRIYDVILAEGASETIMRVALSLMRRNEKKIMDSKEFEEIMQLLLSRSLWEPYDSDADDLVNDFMDMTGLVSREKLKALEHAFQVAHGGDPSAWFGFLPEATSAASRFLGRLWTASTPVKGTLAPHQSGASRPSSFLRRSPSKQSIAISEKSSDMSSDSTNSVITITTDGTTVSRDSSGDAMSMTSKTESMIVPPTPSVSKGDRDLHGQIEDLLRALSDQQRQQAILAAQLQKEREERCDDHFAFEDLVKQLNSGKTHDNCLPAARPQSLHIPSPPEEHAVDEDNRRQTVAFSSTLHKSPLLPIKLDEVVERVDQRLALYRTMQQSRTSQVVETKQRLRNSLMRSKDQLQTEMGRSATLSRQLDEQENETTQVREHLRQAQARLQDEIKEKERLEKTVQELRGRVSKPSSRAGSVIWTDGNFPTIRRSDTQDSRMSLSGSPAGLRELKLGRTSATIDAQNPSGQLGTGGSIPKRTSSLATQAILATEDHVPATEDDLLVELVNAKTSEAMARQELEEVKGKLDAMRKMLGVPSPPALTGSPLNHFRLSPGESAALPSTKAAGPDKLSPPPSATPGGIGSLASGFWGWRRSPSASTNIPAPPAQASEASKS